MKFTQLILLIKCLAPNIRRINPKYFLSKKLAAVFFIHIIMLAYLDVVFSFSVGSYTNWPKKTQERAAQQFQSSEPHINN